MASSIASPSTRNRRSRGARISRPPSSDAAASSSLALSIRVRDFADRLPGTSRWVCRHPDCNCGRQNTYDQARSHIMKLVTGYSRPGRIRNKIACPMPGCQDHRFCRNSLRRHLLLCHQIEDDERRAQLILEGKRVTLRQDAACRRRQRRSTASARAPANSGRPSSGMDMQERVGHSAGVSPAGSPSSRSSAASVDSRSNDSDSDAVLCTLVPTKKRQRGSEPHVEAHQVAAAAGDEADVSYGNLARRLPAARSCNDASSGSSLRPITIVPSMSSSLRPLDPSVSAPHGPNPQQQLGGVARPSLLGADRLLLPSRVACSTFQPSSHGSSWASQIRSSQTGHVRQLNGFRFASTTPGIHSGARATPNIPSFPRAANHTGGLQSIPPSPLTSAVHESLGNPGLAQLGGESLAPMRALLPSFEFNNSGGRSDHPAFRQHRQPPQQYPRRPSASSSARPSRPTSPFCAPSDVNESDPTPAVAGDRSELQHMPAHTPVLTTQRSPSFLDLELQDSAEYGDDGFAGAHFAEPLSCRSSADSCTSTCSNPRSPEEPHIACPLQADPRPAFSFSSVAPCAVFKSFSGLSGGQTMAESDSLSSQSRSSSRTRTDVSDSGAMEDDPADGACVQSEALGMDPLQLAAFSAREALRPTSTQSYFPGVDNLAAWPSTYTAQPPSAGDALSAFGLGATHLAFDGYGPVLL